MNPIQQGRPVRHPSWPPAWLRGFSLVLGYGSLLVFTICAWLSPDGLVQWHYDLYNEWYLEKYVLLPAALLLSTIVTAAELRRLFRRPTNP